MRPPGLYNVLLIRADTWVRPYECVIQYNVMTRRCLFVSDNRDTREGFALEVFERSAAAC